MVWGYHWAHFLHPQRVVGRVLQPRRKGNTLMANTEANELAHRNHPEE
ncbi:hypothetical protein SUDANB148_04727 [Streptomyces sp. SudanB148_2056]